MATSKGRHRKGKAIPPEERQAKSDAIQTDREADHLLRQAHDRTSEVRKVAAALRRIRERNHFGEMVRGALDGM